MPPYGDAVSRPPFCYIVLAHTGTDAVARLVRRIRALSPQAVVLVRHGVEADLDDDDLRAAGAQVLATDTRTRWGGWSQVEAELEAYAHARREIDADRYVLVSGQDYPVADLAVWEDAVQRRGADAVLEPMDLDVHSYGYRWWILDGPVLPGLVKRAADYAAWTASRAVGRYVYVSSTNRREDGRWWVGVRRPGTPARPTKAATWKVMTRRAVDTVLEREAQRPAEKAWVAACKCPDELYVPTAVTAAGLDVQWGRTAFAHFAPGSPNPDWLTPELVEQAVRSGAPFARKVSPQGADAVIAAADAAVGR